MGLPARENRISSPPPDFANPDKPCQADLTGKRLVSHWIPEAADVRATSLRRHLIKIKMGTTGLDTRKPQG
jgi:hypothetical protein